MRRAQIIPRSYRRKPRQSNFIWRAGNVEKDTTALRDADGGGVWSWLAEFRDARFRRAQLS